mmetsp:Transcript_22036/g.48101  ORF Transcript_22036/g.48101 Transcript_22036/m.48101 type:complete len:225 (+) Transcript_22036:2423-3097(+)
MMDRQVSRPIESASLSGPSAMLVPSFMPLSMSSGVPTPSIMQKKASLIMGISTRYRMKPGLSSLTHTFLPRCWHRLLVLSKVWLLVCMPLASSTSGTLTTGCMKCMPTTLWGLLVTAARRVMEMELVLEARMVWTGVTWSSFLKMVFLISSSSGAASITKSALRKGSSDTAVSILPTAAVASSGVILPAFICFSRDLLILPMPFSMISNLRSLSITLIPFCTRI